MVPSTSLRDLIALHHFLIYQPPTLAFLALVKNDGLLVFLYRNMVFEEIINGFPRKLIGATRKTIDKIPYHLCGKMCCLSTAIVRRIDFEKSYRCQFIAETCIACHLACLLAIKSIG